jgi:hypothetical protein
MVGSLGGCGWEGFLGLWKVNGMAAFWTMFYAILLRFLAPAIEYHMEVLYNK